MLKHAFTLLTYCATATFLIRPALAQPCEAQWLPGDGFPGVNSSIRAAVAWDPDGPSGQPTRLVVGGLFTHAGTTSADRIAVWDGAVWSTLGSGMDHTVESLAAMPGGFIVAGGVFTSAGGTPASRVAMWNGTAWLPLGSGFDSGHVLALAAMPGGDVVAGGSFVSSGGVPMNNVARWNGTSWSALGAGMTSEVKAVTVDADGNLLVATTRVYRWSGTSWVQLGGTFNGAVHTLATLANGTVLAGGSFTRSGTTTVNAIAAWNGSAWTPLGAGIGPGYVYSITELPNGDIIAGGGFGGAGGNPVQAVARWNGSSWSAIGQGIRGEILATAYLSTGELFVGGDLNPGASGSTSNITRWTGSEWLPLGNGMDYGVSALAALPNRELRAGGQLTVAGGKTVRGIARRSTTGWQPLGSGMTFTSAGTEYNGTVRSIAVFPNGDIVAGGVFMNAGGIDASRIARWNGQAWSPMGAGMSSGDSNTSVDALLVHSSGDLIAGGRFTEADGVTVNGIARWNGVSWSDLFSGTDGSVSAIIELPNGDVLAAGAFSHAAGLPTNNIARWNGVNWQPLGSGIEGIPGATAVRALVVLPGGDVIAGGTFTTAGGLPALNIARWNGSTWSALGAGINGPSSPGVRELVVAPNGDLVVCGRFASANGVPASNIVRWQPATNQWQPLDSGVDGDLYTLAYLTNGDLAVGGYFTIYAGAQVSPHFAVWGCPPCYANCDRSNTSPVLTGNDFLCFMTKFAAADSYANCDNSTVQPVLNANDFLCFMTAYAAGCPN